MNGWSACQTQKGSLVVGKHITVPIFLKALQVIYCTNKNIFMHKQPPLQLKKYAIQIQYQGDKCNSQKIFLNYLLLL